MKLKKINFLHISTLSKYFVVLLFFLFASHQAKSQDVLIYANGTPVKCTIVFANQDSILFKLKGKESNAPRMVPTSLISKAEYIDKKTGSKIIYFNPKFNPEKTSLFDTIKANTPSYKETIIPKQEANEIIEMYSLSLLELVGLNFSLQYDKINCKKRSGLFVPFTIGVSGLTAGSVYLIDMQDLGIVNKAIDIGVGAKFYTKPSKVIVGYYGGLLNTGITGLEYQTTIAQRTSNGYSSYNTYNYQTINTYGFQLSGSVIIGVNLISKKGFVLGTFGKVGVGYFAFSSGAVFSESLIPGSNFSIFPIYQFGINLGFAKRSATN